MTTKRPCVLLHICCGICAAECINRLKTSGYEVVGFFYNPNIHPESEYLKRKEVVDKISSFFNIKIIYGDYDTEKWFSLCEIYAQEQEGGKRCMLCYELRLKETYNQLQKLGYDMFTTTLTISPHKDSKKIFEIAESISKEKFLKIDFKKQDGFKKTIDFAKKHNFYRQNYCGCIFSMRNKNELSCCSNRKTS